MFIVHQLILKVRKKSCCGRTKRFDRSNLTIHDADVASSNKDVSLNENALCLYYLKCRIMNSELVAGLVSSAYCKLSINVEHGMVPSR